MLIKIPYGEQVYSLKVDQAMTLNEAIEAERLFGGTYKAWGEAAQAGSMLALKVLLYIAVKRDHPDVRFRDLDFRLDEMDYVAEEGDEEPGGDQPEATSNG